VSLSLSDDIQKHTAGEWGKVACCVCVLPPFSNPSEARCFASLLETECEEEGLFGFLRLGD